ncbi:MAG TPA: hypothetical protein VHD56_15270 [Tepidisphaeraceae bacterium]|nr:hypothetical protein [Tepidisphaeraceae bacterium]
MMLNLTIGWTVLVFLLALRDSLRLWVHFRNFVVPRWLIVLLPLAGALMLTMIWVHVARSPYDSWNGARTAPVIGWTKGMPLYYPLGQGPASAFIHGPIAAIARTPTGAILIADFINASLFYIPAILFLLALPCKSNLMRGIGLLVFAGFSLTLPSLLYSAFMVHADAPAVGFGLLALALLAWQTSPNLKWPVLIAAAACSVFSAASKQNMLPIVILLPIFLYVQNGSRDAIILALLELLGLTLVAAMSMLAFGYEPLRFTMFGIVAGHMQWLQMYGKPMSWELGVGFLIADVAAPAMAMAMALLIESCRTGTMQLKTQWLTQRPWMMPFIVAVIMIPSSIVGRVKPGGAENALTPTTYFLVAALAGWIVSHHHRITENGSEPINRLIVSASALLAISLGILCANPTEKSLAY